MEQRKEELLAELKNAIFPSKEGEDDAGGIEHVDMSYKEFMKKLEQLAS